MKRKGGTGKGNATGTLNMQPNGRTQATKISTNATSINGSHIDVYEDDDIFAARILTQQQEYHVALHFYREAISRNPMKKDLLLEEMKTCQLLMTEMRGNGKFISPSQSELVISYAKQAALLACKAQTQCTNPLANEDLHHEQELLMNAYSFYYGWGTTKDLKQAFKCFQKATLGRSTKAEANFRVAGMLFNGEGTTQDVTEAISKFRETALMPNTNPADIFNNHRSIGVGESCHFLGIYCQEVAKSGLPDSCDINYEMSCFWYEIGHKSGHGMCCNSLANMYLRGDGVPQSDFTAATYLEAAIKEKYYMAYVHLARLYIEHMEFHQARRLIKSGLEIQDPKVTETLSKLLTQITSMPEHEDVQREEKVITFESSYDLNREGVPFRERLRRMENAKKYASDIITLNTNRALIEEPRFFVSTLNEVDQDYPYYNLMENTHFSNMCWNIVTHESKYAQQLFEMLIHYCRVIQVLNHHAEDTSKLTKDSKNAIEFVFLLRDLLKRDPFKLKWDLRHFSLVYEILQEIRLADFCSQNADSDSTFVLPFMEALAVCLAEFGAKQPGSELGFKDLVRAWTMYPEEVQLSITLADHYAANKEFERAYCVGAEALERFPNHDNLLFNHAQICLRTTSGIIDCPMEMKRKAIKCLSKFLSVASDDHPKVPEAYYTLGKLYHDIYKEMREPYGLQLSDEVVKHFSQLGEAAERNQLMCFNPYRSLMKDSLVDLKSQIEPTNALSHNGKSDYSFNSDTLDSICQIMMDAELGQCRIVNPNMDNGEPKPIRNFAHDSCRIGLIVGLRNVFKREFVKNGNGKVSTTTTAVHEPSGRKSPPIQIINLSPLWPISLHEALSLENKMWGNRVLDLTVIDEAISGFGSEDIHVVAEDANRDTAHVVFQGFLQDACVQRKFGFGRNIQICRPECKIVDGEKVVNVDDPTAVIFGEKDNSLCRYCLTPGAKTSCSRCRWALYCDRECQTNDWKILKHKSICDPKPFWNVDLHGPS